MNTKKILKVLKIIIIVFIIIGLIISLVVSQDEHHLKTCHDEQCAYCQIIHIAQNIINLASFFIVTIMLGVLIYFFLSRLHKEENAYVQLSLVFQKVQLNE